MKPDRPHILLINPWIHDFAAYDFWAAPLGLLGLAAILRDHGFAVSYRDCLDRFHPAGSPSDPRARYGRGPYHKSRIPKPAGLSDIPRNYCRYGIAPEWFQADLRACDPPDLILVSSLMTYWYPGVAETIAVLRACFPDVPLLLGGIYASLCPEHARNHCGPDAVIPGPAAPHILETVGRYTGFAVSPRHDLQDMDARPYPALDLQRRIPYVPILASRGCPFSCAYCASHILEPEFVRRDPEAVAEEIRYWHRRFGVRSFVFYDDALLMGGEDRTAQLFEAIIRADLPISLHTPNAVHIRGITPKIAELMGQAGMVTLRLGLETTAFERRDLDHKVTEKEFRAAVSHLRNAGFEAEQLGAYLLAGLPGQSMAAIEASIRVTREAGVTPIPAYYSPIPHTALWPEAVRVSRYDLEADPIFTNNAIFPCFERFSWDMISWLKGLAKGG